MVRALRVVSWIAAVSVSLTPTAAPAQTAAPSRADPPQIDTDSDPTRPVFLSLRPEFYDIADGVEQRAMIVRYDASLLPGIRLAHGVPGVLLRFELPFSAADVRNTHASGVGDAYGQLVVMPYNTPRFAWAIGSGFVLPTATDEMIGAGKWVIAPVGAPVWRYPRGLFFIKFQNFTSIGGGSSRPDVNHLLITPTFIRTVGNLWWVLVDSETKTKWADDARTGIKSGLQFGRRIAPGVGLWVKPEAWWGPHRDGRWNLKFGLVWYQRRQAKVA